MRKNQYYQYYVEGEDEQKIIDMLKSDLQIIVPGKVQVFNMTQRRFTKLRLGNLKRGTNVVLVFDTDEGNLSILKENIKFLSQESIISEIICITQVRNLEDELKRSCSIGQIKELLGSRSNSDFKKDLIKEKNLVRKMKDSHFNFSMFWITNDTHKYKEIKNEAYKVKISKKSTTNSV